MRRKNDKLVFGLILGLIGPLLILLLINLSKYPDISFGIFLKTAWIHKQLASWLKISAIFNLATFFLSLNNNFIRVAQGVIAATFVYAGLIVYLMFS